MCHTVLVYSQGPRCRFEGLAAFSSMPIAGLCSWTTYRNKTVLPSQLHVARGTRVRNNQTPEAGCLLTLPCTLWIMHATPGRSFDPHPFKIWFPGHFTTLQGSASSSEWMSVIAKGARPNGSNQLDNLKQSGHGARKDIVNLRPIPRPQANGSKVARIPLTTRILDKGRKLLE